jgi:cysteine desulfurase
MLPFMEGEYGNVASPHLLGRRAASAVAKARGQIAECLQCDESEVCFTSGATEANNLVLLGLSRSCGIRRKIVTSEIEHKSVLEPLNWLAEQGLTIVRLPVNHDGVVDLSAAEEAIDDETLAVTLQAANNEVGTLQPVGQIAQTAHRHGALMHCDAAQLLGKLPFSLYELGADFTTFSTHKAYGPKGVGFLVARRTGARQKLSPIFFGGGQEGGIRPGTLNVTGIVGTGEACRICREKVRDDAQRVSALRDTMERRLLHCSARVTFAGASSSRLPGTSSMLVQGIPADLLISRLPGVCMSIGSACSSGALAPSHVLSAMGFTREDARSAIRLSIGRYNTLEEVERAVAQIVQAIGEILDESPDAVRHHVGDNRKEFAL